MSVKYQVFVSSTYNDLREARDVVIKSILELGHVPVGMEMFSAADEDQWEIIARQIDSSDYYVVILAHRYGSLTPDGRSFTEKEYDYAVRSGVPVLGFLLDESAPWPVDRIEREPKAAKSLAAFRKKLLKRPISRWWNASDLYGKVPISLTKAFIERPRPGWVRRARSVLDLTQGDEEPTPLQAVETIETLLETASWEVDMNSEEGPKKLAAYWSLCDMGMTRIRKAIGLPPREKQDEG